MRASETDRTLICPGSLVLPRTEHSPGDAAAFGTLVHWWKESGETDPSWAHPSHVATLERKLILSGVTREEWWSGGEHEVTFALRLVDAMTYRFTGPRERADKWKADFPAPDWLTGTIDYLWPDGRGDDLKTGSWPVDPRRSGQLKSYALLPWIEAGRPIGWRREWSITQWPKYRLDGVPTRKVVELTGFELMDHLEGLRWAAEHPEEVNPTEEGCRFCPCAPQCEAHLEWMNETAALE